jgi:putative CocE/NonD family hydrolase
MRDGVTLSADLWEPSSDDPHPAILVRTPYLRTMEKLEFPEWGQCFASRGYVFVVQDVRGRGDSEGDFGFLPADRADGYDTIEWLARQPWCDGRIGMLGVSYMGSVQWLAARERPPHLVCLASTAAGGLDVVFNYQGGAFLMGWAVPWTNLVSGRLSPEFEPGKSDWDRVYEHRPILTMDEALGAPMPLYRMFVEHPDQDPHWESVRFPPAAFRKIDIPALHVAGWFDGDQPSALHFWSGMASHSPARDCQHLLLGPWTHEQAFLGGVTKLGELEFSLDSVIDTKAIHLAFFDHYLKEVSPCFDFPRARVYVTGDNRWCDFDEYPPRATAFHRLYLHSAGHANSLAGDGTLSADPPNYEVPDRYAYDPRNPVPSALNGEDLPLDHRPIEERPDVLVYTSGVLTSGLMVIGEPVVELFAASDCRDTDFTAKLLDVHPDGRAVKLGTLPVGVIRARYRRDPREADLLTPGRPESYRIRLFDLAHTFLPGHSVRLEISSSAFPFVAPNQNTGNPVATDTAWQVAHQTIYHDSERPSSLSLPLLAKAELPG